MKLKEAGRSYLTQRAHVAYSGPETYHTVYHVMSYAEHVQWLGLQQIAHIHHKRNEKLKG